MKKIFAITTAVLGCLVTGAQSHHNTYTPHAEFGIKAGLNIANLHVQNASSPDAKLGFNAGGLAHIHVTKHFAVQPEIMYSSQGAKQTVSNTDYKVNLHYINVPVLAQFMVDDGFRIETGPQLGVLASARQKVESTST
ncbi:MAG: porin family protein, partial [Chitinophagaceae bacterium]